MHIGDGELAHLHRVAIDIARRRPGGDHDTDDLVQHIHHRQPRLIGEWRPDIRPRVPPEGGLAGLRGLGVLRGLLLLRRFERVVDCPQAYPRKLLRQLPQFRQLDRIEVGARGEPGEGGDDVILRRLLHCLAHTGGVVFELIDGATVGK